MGMGFAPLAAGAGAQQGLSQLLRQRLLERQMALQEQAQRESMDFRNRSLDQDATQHGDTLALQAAIAGLNQRDKVQARDERQADQLATDLPPGMTMRYGDTVETMRRGGRGDLLKAKPMGMAPSDTQEPAAKGLRIGAPDQMGAKPLTADFAAGEYEKLPTASQKFQMDSADRAEKSAAATAERFEAGQAAMEGRFARGLAAAAERKNTLTPAAKAAEARRLRNEWKAISSNWRTMRGQVSLMDAGLEAAKRGDMAAGSQAVLVTFQKILDPTSVVRESEYARSQAGMSALKQIEGFADRMARGGVGVTYDELVKFKKLGQEMVARGEMELEGTRKQFEDLALESGINPSNIFIGDNPGQPSPGGGIQIISIEEVKK